MLNHDSDDENATFVDISLNNLVVLSKQRTTQPRVFSEFIFIEPINSTVSFDALCQARRKKNTAKAATKSVRMI